MTLGDEWGKAIGDIREAGPRVLQITRHGTAVTVSVGVEKEGKFESEMSQTSADAKAAVAGLSERRAHLFFTGRTVWSEIRLVSGAAANTHVAGPASPAANTGIPATMPNPATVVAVPASKPHAAAGDGTGGGSIFTENGKTVQRPAKPPGSQSFPAASVGEVQRFTHNGPADAVVFTPDGQHVISAGGSDDVIRMWEVTSGKEVRAFRGHSNKIGKLSISADGKTLASGSYDKTARTWNVETGQQTAMFRHGRDVSAIALSGDAHYVIVGDFGGNPVIYDLTSGTKVSGFHSEGGYAAAFSASGRYAATGGWNHVNHVWDTRGGLREVLKATQPDQVYAEAFSFDETRLMSAGPDKAIHVWDLKSGKELLTCTGHTGTIHGVACCPGDRMLVSGAEDDTVRVWSLQTGREITEFSGGKGKVFGVAVSPDGHLAASAEEDGSVRLWKLPDPSAAPVPPTAAAPSRPVTAPASPSAPGGRKVNLLNMFADHSTVLSGVWDANADGVLCLKGGRLLFNYSPPEEYDLQIEFVRRTGNDAFAPICPLSLGGTVAWFAGGWGNHSLAFTHFVRGGWASLTKHDMDAAVKNGERYTATICIRRDSARAYYNGELVSETPGDGKGLNAGENEVCGKPVIGLIVDDHSSAMIHKMEVTEVTGQGQTLSAPRQPDRAK